MAVLVERFTVVLAIEAVVERYPGGWDGLWAEPPNGSGRHDDDLVAFSFASRPEFRAWLERLERHGFADAGTILAATELSERIRTPEQIAELQARIATTRELALVYRRQPCRPPWLAFDEACCPGTQVVVGGAWLAGMEPVGLATPAGWSVEDAVPERDEPESGDELLPTWHEFVRSLPAEEREEMLRWGPEAFQAFSAFDDAGRLFASPIRPAPNVIERERIVRDPDGTERVMLERWTKFPD